LATGSDKNHDNLQSGQPVSELRFELFLENMMYKGPSITSGTGAAIWLKTNFGHGHITLDAVLFCAYAPFSVLLTFFK
jgi:hypothetical protein